MKYHLLKKHVKLSSYKSPIYSIHTIYSNTLTVHTVLVVKSGTYMDSSDKREEEVKRQFGVDGGHGSITRQSSSRHGYEGN